MKTSIALGLGLILTTASGAMAGSTPPTTVLVGTAAQTNVTTATTQCATGAGLATFQRGTIAAATPRPKALIDMPGLAFQPPSPAAPIYYYGMTILTFANATSGTVSFDYNPANTKLPDGETVPFSAYVQTWSPLAGTLDVKFTLGLKNCTLPVHLLFRAGAPL